jgi:hypothetical protein
MTKSFAPKNPEARGSDVLNAAILRPVRSPHPYTLRGMRGDRNPPFPLQSMRTANRQVRVFAKESIARLRSTPLSQYVSHFTLG